MISTERPELRPWRDSDRPPRHTMCADPKADVAADAKHRG